MKHPIAVLTVLCLLAVPAFAGNLNEVFGTFAYQKSDDIGQTRDFTFELNAGLTSLLSAGPVVEYTYLNPSEAGVKTADVMSVGGQVVLSLDKSHNGLQGGLAVLVPTGDAEGTVVKPWVGIAFGTEHVALRARWSHPYNYGFTGHEDAIDLGRDIVDAAIGFRWK